MVARITKEMRNEDSSNTGEGSAAKKVYKPVNWQEVGAYIHQWNQ